MQRTHAGLWLAFQSLQAHVLHLLPWQVMGMFSLEAPQEPNLATLCNSYQSDEKVINQMVLLPLLFIFLFPVLITLLWTKGNLAISLASYFRGLSKLYFEHRNLSKREKMLDFNSLLRGVPHVTSRFFYVLVHKYMQVVKRDVIADIRSKMISCG